MSDLGFGEYQSIAATFATKIEDPKVELAARALGLAGESGEVVEIIKKHLEHGKDIDAYRVAEELGDVLWYVAEIATILGFSLHGIASDNLDKLAARYKGTKHV